MLVRIAWRNHFGPAVLMAAPAGNRAKKQNNRPFDAHDMRSHFRRLVVKRQPSPCK